MSFEMQILVERGGEMKWISIAPLNKAPYRYHSEAEAWRDLRICYPDHVGGLILGAEPRARVIEVGEPPNMERRSP